MGTYRAPGQVIDTSYQELNKQVAFNINKYDQLFAQRKQLQREQMEKNAKLKEKQDLARVEGSAKWHKELRDNQGPGGYGEANNKKIAEWTDEYYDLIGKTDTESLKRINQLMGYPKILADWYGAAKANDIAYTEGLGFGKDEANGIDYVNSDHDNLLYSDAFHENPSQLEIHETENGDIMIGLGDLRQNAQTFINGSLEGQSYLNYNGDYMTALAPQIEGIQANMKYLESGEEIIDARGVVHTTDRDFTQANVEYKEKLRNYNYDKTLGDQKYMASIFPQLVNKVQTAADADKTSEAAKLLYGADGEPGGEGVNADANMEVGPWVGSDVEQFGKNAEFQRAIATEGFYVIGTSDQFMKPDQPIRTKTKYVNQQSSSSSSSSPYTKKEMRDINNQANVDLYNNNLKLAERIYKNLLPTIGEAGSGRSGHKTMDKSKRNEAINILANELNTINRANIDINDPKSKGTWKLGDGGGLVFEYHDGSGEKVKEDFELTDDDLSSAAAINKLLTVTGGGMSETVYDYYTQNSNQGSGGSGDESDPLGLNN